MSSSRSVVDCSLSEVLQMASSLINSTVAILVFLYNVTGTVSKLTILIELTILIGALWFLGAVKALVKQIYSFLDIIPSSSHVPSSSEWIWAITSINFTPWWNSWVLCYCNFCILHFLIR